MKCSAHALVFTTALFLNACTLRADPATIALATTAVPSVWERALNVRADSLAAFTGMMDTKMFGTGDIVGGVFEICPLPFLSLQLRGSYADQFDGLEGAATYLEQTVGSSLDIEEFAIVPLELGIVARFPLSNYFSIYAGGGWGYYVTPAFTLVSDNEFQIDEDIDDISGYWGLVGLEAGFHPIFVFAEAKFSKIFVDEYEIPVDKYGIQGTLTTDIDLSGATLLAGVRLKW